MAGMIATFKNVLELAILFASLGDAPEWMAASLKFSNHLPIIGKINATDSIPPPPIRDKPKAPVLGRYSETNPSMVGQKKQIPTANTIAAPKAAFPLAWLNVPGDGDVLVVEVDHVARRRAAEHRRRSERIVLRRRLIGDRDGLILRRRRLDAG